ncbi:MAG: AAA family ATPase [Verrucomicrobiales bacterium]|nr:AAA family ATPase [Verrucomicrobiales bacterium]
MSRSDVPLQSPTDEQGCLGCALMDSNLISKLRLDLFHDIRHQALVTILRTMMEEGHQIDTVTVSAFVERTAQAPDVGGLPYLNTLPDTAGSSAQFDYFLQGLEDFALRRAVASETETIKASINDLSTPALQVLDAAESRILSLRPKGGNRRKTRGELMADITNDLEEAARNPGQIQGLPTGFHQLDQMLWGLKPGQLVVVGGRPGHGKSALMLQIAHNAAAAGHPVAYISLEMGAKELMFRLQCSCSEVPSEIANKGAMGPEEEGRFLKATTDLCRVPIHFEDGDVHTLDRIKPVARQMLKEEGVKLIVIDYLQLIQSSNKRASRYEGITEVSGSLKQLARGLGVPIIIGSQFSRDVEKEGRRPQLSDLRDSGSIEQDADIVLLLHQKPEQGTEAGVPTELLIGKNRGGKVGKVPLFFQRSLTKFREA